MKLGEWSVECKVYRPHEIRQMSQSAPPATQNDRSTSSDTLRKTDTQTLVLRRPCIYIPCETRRMSQSAPPATQNDMNTSSDTSRKTLFAASPIDTPTFSATTVARKPLRTVADSCRRLRTPKAGSREHVSTPRPPM